MICKDDVLAWFKGLSSHNRIDVMCSLLHKCLPFELRFLGTCLENLGRQDFNQMKEFEVKANNTCELSDFHTQSCIISDTRTRQKLALYVCLLHSLNTSCSTIIYKCLYGIDVNQVVSKARNSEEKILEELLLIYTVAVNHPAFTFEQRSNLGYILLRLAREEMRLQAEKLADTVSADYAQQDGMELPRTDIHPPPVPPGVSVPPPGIIHYPMYFPGQQLPNQIFVQVVNYPPMGGESGPPPPSYGSPRVSRHSSPSPSQQQSRSSSPVRMNLPPPKGRPVFNEILPTASYVDRSDAPPLKDSSVNPDNEVRNVAERLMGLSTDDMERGAAVNLNGVAAPSVVRSGPTVNQRLPYDADLGHSHNFIPPAPSGLRTPLIHSRYNQQSTYRENLHGLGGSRNCSSSSSGSDASSTTHSPPNTPASYHRAWEKGREGDDYKARRGGGSRHRGRFGGGIQTLPRERAPMGMSVRAREGPRSAPPTPHDENKTYSVPPPVSDVGAGRIAGDMVPAAAPMAITGPFLPPPFTTAPPLFPPYPPAFVRPPYTYHNGEVLYTYQTPAPTPPFPPSALVTYTSSIPPPKTACYNCSSQTHHPTDCKEPTMEEYCSKGQYRIDYGKAELLDK